MIIRQMRAWPPRTVRASHTPSPMGIATKHLRAHNPTSVTVPQELTFIAMDTVTIAVIVLWPPRIAQRAPHQQVII